jgi:hypothetical protein
MVISLEGAVAERHPSLIWFRAKPADHPAGISLRKNGCRGLARCQSSLPTDSQSSEVQEWDRISPHVLRRADSQPGGRGRYLISQPKAATWKCKDRFVGDSLTKLVSLFVSLASKTRVGVSLGNESAESGAPHDYGCSVRHGYRAKEILNARQGAARWWLVYSMSVMTALKDDNCGVHFRPLRPDCPIDFITMWAPTPE